ncbi:MAG: preprotein translocase subunit SecG [Lachnospiraceae bacterium]|nr:preprotein translocase subunit SecG [Lachnospiraceae bacterium]
MEILRIILTVVFILVCVVLVGFVLRQEGKSAGLGAIGGGSSDTYWGKNKGRSREAKLARATTILAVLFIVLAVVLNINRF